VPRGVLMRRIIVRLLLAVAATFLLIAQSCPDYTQDDEKGSVPAGTPPRVAELVSATHGFNRHPRCQGT
ncbi:MAG: hypothetical protein ACXW2Q_13755, partial [Thermoanaerobaculia bacterium]